ncbi:MAG: hypothetical protein K8R37_15975 [Bacteroidales bacterium]|nr:hypothetical protein [Bacteroidales bacterium]
MNYNIEIMYNQYIKPLDNYDRLLIIQKILQDLLQIKSRKINSNDERLTSLRKFKGIAKNKNMIINKEDWYKQ